MANLEKYRKSLIEEWLEAEVSDLPSRARSPRLVGQYIKDRRLAPNRALLAAASRKRQYLMRLDAMQARPEIALSAEGLKPPGKRV
jgi:hypothetical protein